MVRNGYHDPREVVTAAVAVPVPQPRVNDKRIDEATGERMRFSSAILPALARKSPGVAEVLPLLYLHGMPSGDFMSALKQFIGSAAGLSASILTRLTAQWQDDATALDKRSLKGTDYVYGWVDGIHLKVRLEQDKVCLRVILGVRADGTKELVALTDGFRESSQSWVDLLRDCKRRSMRAPVLAIGDGALGFWKAIREVFPQTKEQPCWFHAAGNVLAALPKSAQPGAKAALAGIWGAEDKDHALKAAKTFADLYGAKWPKAGAKITEHLGVLLAFYDYPAEHWIDLRTTNPIESTFAAVQLRQRVAAGPGSRVAGVAMASRLMESAEKRWSRGQGAAPGGAALCRREIRERQAHGTTRESQEVTSKSPDTPIHRSRLLLSGDKMPTPRCIRERDW